MSASPIIKALKRLAVLNSSYGILFIIISVHVAFFTIYGLQKHAAFQTAGFDLGIWDQKVWNILHGHPFVLTAYHEIGDISLGDHVDPISLLIFPFYGLYSSPETLIVLQVVLVSLGAIPIYWLARSKLNSELAGLIFASVYLLFPALEGAIIFDFHGITLSAPFLAYALWAMDQRQYRCFVVMVVLAMACQEDVPLLTLMMGLYVIGIQRNWRVGGIVVVISCLWFAIANFIIIPTFSLGGNNIHFYRYEALGDDLGQIIIAVLTRPDLVFRQVFAGDKQLYWIRLTMPTAFTALIDPLTLLIASPSMLINTLSTYPPTYQLDRFHSSAPIVPFVVVSSINGLVRLVKFTTPNFKHIKPAFFRNIMLLMIFFVTLIYHIQFGHSPLGRYFEWPVVTKHHHKAETMLAQIPRQAVVAAQNNLVPRLSEREWIFILPKLSHHNRQADYVAIDMRSSLTPYRFIEEYCVQLDGLLANPNYGLIFADDGLLLFKQGVDDSANFTPMSPCL